MAVPEVYLDTLSVMESLRDFKSPKSKLTTMIRSGEVIQVRRGQYISGDSKDWSEKTMANKIYGPSYISFEYALSMYQLIPERVSNVTSAVFNKNKRKTFNTPLGIYLYQPVPAAAYPKGFVLQFENGHPFLIATPEKAICDLLYLHRSVRRMNQIGPLLLSGLRIEMEDLAGLNEEILESYADLYQNRVHKLFVQWMKKEIYRA